MNGIDKEIERLIDQQSLDGQATDLLEYDDQEQLTFELELQKKIDASLRRSFSSEPTGELVHRKKMENLVSNSKSPDRRQMAFRIAVLAASLLLLASALVWQGNTNDSTEIGYNREPLAELYQKTLDRGFKPYYFCEDPDRFAEQFQKQLDAPLRLSEMPAHKKMVGITFIGGVSRKTTSMLGLVNDKPVLVFVDKISNDDQGMRSQVGKSGRYHVSRATKDGLVFYEVSGHEDAQLIEYFERIDQK